MTYSDDMDRMASWELKNALQVARVEVARFNERIPLIRADERAKMHALLLQMRDGWWWAGSFLGASPDQYARANHYGAGQALDFAANHLRSLSPLGLPTTEREQKK